MFSVFTSLTLNEASIKPKERPTPNAVWNAVSKSPSSNFWLGSISFNFIIKFLDASCETSSTVSDVTDFK